jgi:hypothetical protein
MKKLSALFMIIMLSLTFASALEIREVRTADFWDRISLFSIFTDKSSYEQGQLIVVDEFQNINEHCLGLGVTTEMYNIGTGNKVASTSRYLGNVYPMTAYIQVTQDSGLLDVGEYKIVSNWKCDGVILGEDGWKELPNTPTVATFSVVKNSIFTNPEQECSKNCAVGEELINPTSTECFCQVTWDSNDGRCDLGEPSVTDDCIEAGQQETDTQSNVDNEDVTSDTSDDVVDDIVPGTSLTRQDKIIGVGILVLVVGVLLYFMLK